MVCTWQVPCFRGEFLAASLEGNSHAATLTSSGALRGVWTSCEMRTHSHTCPHPPVRRLCCTSGQVLPGDRLLLMNGAAVTGLETEDVARMFLALEGPTVALTVIPKSCQGPG
jgi:hypothetical protein